MLLVAEGEIFLRAFTFTRGYQNAWVFPHLSLKKSSSKGTFIIDQPNAKLEVTIAFGTILARILHEFASAEKHSGLEVRAVTLRIRKIDIVLGQERTYSLVLGEAT